MPIIVANNKAVLANSTTTTTTTANQNRRRVTPISNTQYNLNSPILPTRHQLATTTAGTNHVFDDELTHNNAAAQSCYTNMLYDSSGHSVDEYAYFGANKSHGEQLNRYLSLDEKSLNPNRMGDQQESLATPMSHNSGNSTAAVKQHHSNGQLFTLITNPNLLSSNITVRSKASQQAAPLSISSSSSSASLSVVNTSTSSTSSSSLNIQHKQQQQQQQQPLATTCNSQVLYFNSIERKKNASDSNVKTLATDHNFYHINNQQQPVGSKLAKSVPKDDNDDDDDDDDDQGPYLTKAFNNRSLLMLSNQNGQAAPVQSHQSSIYDSIYVNGSGGASQLPANNNTNNSPKQYYASQCDNTSNTSGNNFSLNLSIHTAEEFSKEMFAWLQNEHKPRSMPIKSTINSNDQQPMATTVTTTAATLVWHRHTVALDQN